MSKEKIKLLVGCAREKSNVAYNVRMRGAELAEGVNKAERWLDVLDEFQDRGSAQGRDGGGRAGIVFLAWSGAVAVVE